jgi:hypothetical protein
MDLNTRAACGDHNHDMELVALSASECRATVVRAFGETQLKALFTRFERLCRNIQGQ